MAAIDVYWLISASCSQRHQPDIFGEAWVARRMNAKDAPTHDPPSTPIQNAPPKPKNGTSVEGPLRPLCCRHNIIIINNNRNEQKQSINRRIALHCLTPTLLCLENFWTAPNSSSALYHRRQTSASSNLTKIYHVIICSRTSRAA